MSQPAAVASRLFEILDRVLPDGLAPDWGAERPLAEAGLDSVAVLTIVSEVEAAFGFRFRDEDLSAESFDSVAALARLVTRRGGRP